MHSIRHLTPSDRKNIIKSLQTIESREGTLCAIFNELKPYHYIDDIIIAQCELYNIGILEYISTSKSECYSVETKKEIRRFLTDFLSISTNYF